MPDVTRSTKLLLCGGSAKMRREGSRPTWRSCRSSPGLRAVGTGTMFKDFGKCIWPDAPHRPPSPLFKRVPDALYSAHDKVRTFSPLQFNSKRYSSYGPGASFTPRTCLIDNLSDPSSASSSFSYQH